MELPSITIITPSLNQAAYLERTIRSVLDQGYPMLEYIVVDGGSTDGSVEILEQFSKQIAYWASERDEGQAHAINKGLRRATGDVVAYINSDDFYLPGAFATVSEIMANRGVQWCAGSCRYEYSDGTLHELYVPHPPRMSRRRMIIETWYVPQASSFWRREVFEEVGLLREDLDYVFDLEFGLRCALNSIEPTCIDDELAVRYLHQETKSATPERFAEEYRTLLPELQRAYLRPHHYATDILYRAQRRLRRLRTQLA